MPLLFVDLIDDKSHLGPGAHRAALVLHFNVTDHATAEWVVQQLRAAFPEAGPYRYAIFDRDSTFVRKWSPSEGNWTEAQTDKHTGALAEWNCGKMIGSARRDCFDHVIALNEAHIRRLGREFIAYYHEDRTHLGLDKDTPSARLIEGKPEGAELESLVRVGGLHHRYGWKAAA